MGYILVILYGMSMGVTWALLDPKDADAKAVAIVISISCPITLPAILASMATKLIIRRVREHIKRLEEARKKAEAEQAVIEKQIWS
jgi:hypothetical protein